LIRSGSAGIEIGEYLWVPSKMNLLDTDNVAPGEASTIDIASLAESPRVKPDGGIMSPMVSYAQNFEDVMLRRALQDIKCGFYVDIGAADPDTDSVTRWFYEIGWRGINVEPDPLYFSKIEERRSGDRNLKCVIGAENANVIFNVTRPGGASTASAERLVELLNVQQASTTPMLMPAITLDELLILSCGRVIDFLKIDVEGMEDAILSGASLVSQRPRIIVAEATLFDRQIPSHQIWEPKLLAKGYKFAWFDGLNRFYVRCEDEWRLELFRVPPCHFDNFFKVTLRKWIDEIGEEGTRTTADLESALAASRMEVDETRREAADAVERSAAALSEANINAISARTRAESIEAELLRITAECERHTHVLAASRLEVDATRREAADAVERSAAALSEANINAISARTRAEAVEGELRATAAEFELRRVHLESRIEDLLDREREFQHRHDRMVTDVDALQANLAQRESEIALIAATSDAATAQSLRWLGAATPSDQDRLDSLRQYPFQSKFYRIGLCRWLAVGLKRRRRILTAAAARARDRRNWELAARYYQEALDLAPDRAELWVQYGHALKEAGNLSAGESAYRKSLDLNPRSADTHLQLGHVLKLQGRYPEAADAYLCSLTLDPRSPYATRELVALGSTVQVANALAPGAKFD
jgi:FkbM family methyltransferase